MGALKGSPCWQTTHPFSRTRERWTTSFMILRSMTTGMLNGFLPSISSTPASWWIIPPLSPAGQEVHHVWKVATGPQHSPGGGTPLWWNRSGQLAEKCAVSFIPKAHPTRWCACQPFQAIGMNEGHSCPCLRQFSILHLGLRSRQPQQAATTLARLLDRNFS